MGTRWLMTSLLYGSGLRVIECLRLRVKDVDLFYRQILVRDGKGEKDRVTMLPSGGSGQLPSTRDVATEYTVKVDVPPGPSAVLGA